MHPLIFRQKAFKNFSNVWNFWWFFMFWNQHMSLLMGQSPGPARALPRPVHFFRNRDSGLTQDLDWFFEKDRENWDFYLVKNRGSSRFGIKLFWRAWARLEINIQGSGSTQDQFFRSQPITSVHSYTYLLFLDIYLFSVYSLIYLIQTIS